MNTIPTLTPFEKQVMQAIRHVDIVGGVGRANGGNIFHYGRILFGPDWGGSRRSTYCGFTYPTIDAALGRLHRKGLIYRMEFGSPMAPDRGRWVLTELGNTLMGIG